MAGFLYLDHNATTAVDTRVLDVMLPLFTENYGNASSRTHRKGWEAAQAVDTARAQVAGLLNCTPQEIIFTSGATEAINLAIRGVMSAWSSRGKHLITAATEHKAVLDTCRDLEQQGCQLTLLPVNREGLVDPAALRAALRPDTVLVCIMHANNETGTVQPIRQLADITHAAGALFMSDTTQSAGKIPVDVQELGIDICCISAHKMYGPKGAGALYIRRRDPRVTLHPVFTGGGHERGLRPGTLNVPGIAALGKACQLAAAEWWDNASRISSLRTRFEQILTDLPDVFVNGSIRNRLPNTTHLTFNGIRADQLIARLPHIGMATGSACTSALPEPSHVLTAMGLSAPESHASIRFSLGTHTPETETLQAAREIAAAVLELRLL
ncbi:MAG: cysteine desulfurase [Bacteroidetes bacterium]|nr:cysteine desulfurase [Bacteroidota bacterium]